MLLRLRGAATGTGERFTWKRLPVPAARRISETRVRCVPAVMMLGTGLSVEHDMAARPVHDRTRVRDTQMAARRESRCSSLQRRREVTRFPDEGCMCKIALRCRWRTGMVQVRQYTCVRQVQSCHRARSLHAV